MHKEQVMVEDLTKEQALNALKAGQAVLMEMVDISKKFDPSQQKKYQINVQKFFKICKSFFQGSQASNYREGFQLIGKFAFSNSMLKDHKLVKEIHGGALYKLIWMEIIFARNNPELIESLKKINETKDVLDNEATYAMRLMKLCFEGYDKLSEDISINDSFVDRLEFAKGIVFRDSWQVEWAAMERAKMSSRVGLLNLSTTTTNRYPGAM